MSFRPQRTDGRTDLMPGRIALFYAAIGIAWIYGSGWIVNLLTSGSTNSFLEFAKGTGYVVATAGGLWIILARRARSIAQAEAARAAADVERTRLAAAVEQAAEGVVITDAQAQIAYVNPAFEAISGYSRAELVGRNASVLGGSEDRDVNERLWSSIRSEEAWHGSLVNVRADGRSYEVDASIGPFRDSQGRLAGFVGVERDVSLERALARELEEAGRMEAVGQLAGGIAHDFNNQLMAIAGYAEIIRGEVHGNSLVEKDAAEIMRATRSAAVLVRQLLELARRAVQDPRPLSPADLLVELRPMLDGLLGPRVRLTVDAEKGLGRIFADPHQVEQVLVNLIVNARDAMPDGGTVLISLSNAEIDATDPVAARVRPGRYVVMSVTDTGSGMSKETMARAFEPFFTTKAPGHGTGLGLATTYGIVSQSHGYIAVESEVGRGTTFTIHLPRSDEPAYAPASGAGAEAAPGGRETILLLEDEEAVRQIVTRTLGRLGYTVLVVADADEARARWATDGRRVDLLITDVRLPGMDGPTLAGILRRDRPDLRVLFMSGYAGDALLEGGLVGPDDSFLGKPFGTDELAHRVRVLLDARPEKS